MEFERLELLIGKENLEKLKNTTCLVIGLGGVGGYVVESLARSGVGNLILVDKDTVDITNINRQIIALHSNIGEYKTEVFKSRIKDINENCNVDIITDFITPENINKIFIKKIDYIIDAIDYIETKKELIRFSDKNNIKLISSMGTGKKLDPTKIKITTLDKTSYDPIARILRKMVKDEHINSKIKVVYSDEVPIKKSTKEIPSNAFVPSVAGLFITSYIVNDIVGEK